jgi:hypothetical protein
MEIDNKTELLMVLIALENASDLILKDERVKEYHERTYTMLFNKVAEEYAAYANDEEESIVAAILNNY